MTVFLVILNAMPHPHLVSFVIPAWNEESVLGPTLEAVRVATRHGAHVVNVHHRRKGRQRRGSGAVDLDLDLERSASA